MSKFMQINTQNSIFIRLIRCKVLICQIIKTDLSVNDNDGESNFDLLGLLSRVYSIAKFLDKVNIVY